ncbi:MAG: transporter substrate-binding domain-containing protein [Coriobacteriales bacterium]|nr:transporter substrate-binding domain-containing protein [Coriobacteriales bacterium]
MSFSNQNALSRRDFLRFTSSVGASTLAVGSLTSLFGCSKGETTGGEAAAATASGGNYPSGAAVEAGDVVLYNATQNDYPPFTFLDTDGSLAGLDADFVRELDTRLVGYTIEHVMASDNGLLGVDSGRFDLMIDQMAITPEREQTYLFSEPYFTAQTVIVVQKGNPLGIQSLDDLAGHKAAGQPGSSYTTILERYNTEHPDSPIEILYGDYDTGQEFEQIEKGIVDAVVEDPVMTRAYISDLGSQVEIVGEPVATEPIAIVLAKNDHGAELKALLDPIIIELIADGTISQLSEQWLEQDFTPRR